MQRAKYSEQVLITFYKPNTSSDVGLQTKIEIMHTPTELKTIYLNIKEKNYNKQFSELNCIDHKSRIYIHGHGTINYQDNIFDDAGNAINYQTLAKFLANNLTDPSLKEMNVKPRLKISLAQCESKGFAEKLHYELSKYGIYCDLVARISFLRIDSKTGRKYTADHGVKREDILKLGEELSSRNKDIYSSAMEKVKLYTKHHQHNSKVIFIWNNENNQIMKDAYETHGEEKYDTEASAMPLYRKFEKAEYSQEKLIEKGIMDTILLCRDNDKHPPERYCGLNQLADDIYRSNSLKEKLECMEQALKNPDRYHLKNKVDSFTFLSSLLSLDSTKAYAKITSSYEIYKKQYEALNMDNKKTLK